ncbi:MAG TPA: GNAT family protein [Povalibacter sp.]
MTLRYVYGHDEIVARFVAQMIPHIRDHANAMGNCKTIGVIDGDGKLIAGLVYHAYDPPAGRIEITGAALPKSRWLTRETIRRMYRYPFDEIGVQMVVQHTPADNEELLEQLARGGYMFVHYPRMYGRHRDGVICLLTAEEWARNPINQRINRDAEIKEAA